MKLNIGAGAHPLEGYVSIDRKTGGEAFPLKTGNDGIGAVPDDSVDEIYASHVLEHFSYKQTLDVLKEWVRALKPGGILKVAVPDLDVWDKMYNADNSAAFPLEGYMFGGQLDDDDFHKSFFNEPKLTQLLHMAGCGDVRRWKHDGSNEDCSRLPISLNLMAVKGAPAVPDLSSKIAGVFSINPRCAITENMFCATRVSTRLRINMTKRGGAFWGPSLQQLMEANVDKVPYIMTVDFDTVFEPEDVLALYRLLEDNPGVDAVNAVQVGRDRSTVLMTIAGEDGNPKTFLAPEDTNKELMPVLSAHFGLTLIRTSALKKMPKPWFLGVPDDKGEWGEGRTDEDVYFWKKFRECGLKLCQANRVVVGHCQFVVSWPDKSLSPIHQYLPTYGETGKPDGCWE